MEGLKMVPYIALVLMIAGVILGATIVTLAKFQETITDVCANSSYTYNSSTDTCGEENRTTGGKDLGRRNFTGEYYSVWTSIEAEGTVAQQQSTIAIIAVMVIIISMLAGVFVYMRYFA